MDSSISKLYEYSQKKKVKSPSYSFEEIIHDDVKIFECTCDFINYNTSSTGFTKKEAKHKASNLMYGYITQIPQESKVKAEVVKECISKEPDVECENAENCVHPCIIYLDGEHLEVADKNQEIMFLLTPSKESDTRKLKVKIISNEIISL